MQSVSHSSCCFYMQWADLSEIDSITITDLCENNCTVYNPANRYSQNSEESYEQVFFQ